MKIDIDLNQTKETIIQKMGLFSQFPFFIIEPKYWWKIYPKYFKKMNNFRHCLILFPRTKSKKIAKHRKRDGNKTTAINPRKNKQTNKFNEIKVETNSTAFHEVNKFVVIYRGQFIWMLYVCVCVIVLNIREIIALRLIKFGITWNRDVQNHLN